MASNEEWNVPNSDDERDEELILMSKNGENKDDIPIKVLGYYEQIDQNKVLELKVEEFRKFIPVLKDNSKEVDACEVNEGENNEKCKEDNNDSSKDAIVIIEDDEDKKEEKRAKEPSEFDEFDEPEECQGHIPKRTPKSGRLPKKRVGTLKNVISNLKRFREMDNVSEGKECKTDSSDEVKEERNSTVEDKPTNASKHITL